jgi:hypothetical protein
MFPGLEVGEQTTNPISARPHGESHHGDAEKSIGWLWRLVWQCKCGSTGNKLPVAPKGPRFPFLALSGMAYELQILTL